MPAAIPLAVAGGTSLIGGLLGNSQNKSNQQNANNQAQASREYDQQALQTALANYASYLKANPSPVSSIAPIQSPGQVNSPTTTVNNGSSANPSSMVAQLLGLQQSQPQPAAQPTGQVSALPNHMLGSPATGAPGGVTRRIALPGNGVA